LTPVKHGRYSSITRPRIKELIERFNADPDPLNLQPEVVLLRALLTDFVERYDELTDAVLAWHASFSDGYAGMMKSYGKLYTAWREKMTAILERGGWQDLEAEDLPVPPTPPDPLGSPGKPRQMLDVSAASSLVDRVGRMVERVEKLKSEGSITLETLNRVLEQFGVEVVQAAMEEVADDASRARLLRNVERRWGSIRLEPGGASRAPQSGLGPN